MKQIILLGTALFICFLSQAQTNVISFYFEVNLSIPTPLSQQELLLFKEKVNKKECIIEKVCAYTDSIGSSKYNEALAKKRLQFVTNQLEIEDSSSIPQLALALKRVYDTQSFLNWRRVDVYYLQLSENSKETIQADTIIAQAKEVEPQLENTDEDVVVDEIKPSFYSSTPYILNVEFVEGTAKLYQKSLKEISNLANFLNENTSARILIRGHVCCGKNRVMSKKRAKTVYKELIKLGVSKSRLDYIGMSNKEPLVKPELNDSDRQRNRRVDVKFQGM